MTKNNTYEHKIKILIKFVRSKEYSRHILYVKHYRFKDIMDTEGITFACSIPGNTTNIVVLHIKSNLH